MLERSCDPIIRKPKPTPKVEAAPAASPASPGAEDEARLLLDYYYIIYYAYTKLLPASPGAEEEVRRLLYYYDKLYYYTLTTLLARFARRGGLGAPTIILRLCYTTTIYYTTITLLRGAPSRRRLSWNQLQLPYFYN